ncbi:HEPN domain-containing protein [Hymenobacter sp. DG25B]|uniref:HEPN domain-containing protein n=1 Tax=Hymenobacter sp. DG25B TaxID=1385664 RepID=UPI0012E017C4|nr:HEPN domain-containing protein [Hymenobacter sp. DG25B]
MAYSKSIALIQFESTIEDLLIRCNEFRASSLSYKSKTLAFQGSILLTCSSLENYLKSLIDDWISKLRLQHATMDKLPQKTRKIIYIRHQSSLFKNFTFNGNEHAASLKVNFTDFSFMISNNNSTLPSFIRGVHIYGNKKYPSIDNIKKMFSTLEIEDIFKSINIKYKKNYTLYLESFLGVRESLAHEFPPNVTYADATRHLRNIRTLSRKIDSIAYSNLSISSGSQFWPA